MEGLSNENSYFERRQLFKDIWVPISTVDEKDNEATNKPKVIKTVRLDDVDRCFVSKKRNGRIKNLRTVCNHILDICERNNADEILYEPVSAKEFTPCSREIRGKTRKTKALRKKRKIKPERYPLPASEGVNFEKNISNDNYKSRNTSPVKQSNLDRKNTFINIH